MLFFDDNCSSLKHQKAQSITEFDDISQAVDRFHMKVKHKATDAFCQANCDWKKFPDLFTPEGDPRFNSSAAEMTNVWLSGFKNIVRNMKSARYRLFLDEMVLEKNRMTLKRIEQKGWAPYMIPRD